MANKTIDLRALKVGNFHSTYFVTSNGPQACPEASFDWDGGKCALVVELTNFAGRTSNAEMDGMLRLMAWKKLGLSKGKLECDISDIKSVRKDEENAVLVLLLSKVATLSRGEQNHEQATTWLGKSELDFTRGEAFREGVSYELHFLEEQLLHSVYAKLEGVVKDCGSAQTAIIPIAKRPKSPKEPFVISPRTRGSLASAPESSAAAKIQKVDEGEKKNTRTTLAKKDSTKKHSTKKHSAKKYSAKKYSAKKHSNKRDVSATKPIEKPQESLELGPNQYAAERIVKRRKRNGKIEYLVKWIGFKSAENTWEPEENVAECEAFAEFKGWF